MGWLCVEPVFDQCLKNWLGSCGGLWVGSNRNCLIHTGVQNVIQGMCGSRIDREHISQSWSQHFSKSLSILSSIYIVHNCRVHAHPSENRREKIQFSSGMCEQFGSLGNPSYTKTATASGPRILTDNCTWWTQCFPLSSYLFLLFSPFMVGRYWFPSVIAILYFPYSTEVIFNFEPFKENINWL